MGQVYPAVAECDRPRHEVYVLTDLARSSWNPEQPAEGLDQVEKAKTSPAARSPPSSSAWDRRSVNDVAIDAAEPASTVGDPGRVARDQGPGPRRRAPSPPAASSSSTSTA